MSADTGKLGQAPWGAVLGRAGGDDGSGGLPAGTVDVTAPITGDGSPGSPVGISAATTVAAGSMSAADKVKLNGLTGTVAVTAPITGDGSGGSPVGISAASTTAAGSMSAVDKAKLNFVEADWALATVRYFAVDTAGGNDANAGFSDVSMAAAGAVAVKTLARLLVILPAVGAGRLAVVAIKTGTYAEVFRMVGVSGYRYLLIRGTTDFSNTATDKAVAGGAISLAGPNGNGSFTVLAGGTSSVFSVTGTPFTVEPALLGARVRWLTGALAGQCSAIWKNTTSQITVLDNFTGAPTVGDTFVIEEPGVLITGAGLVSGCIAGSETALESAENGFQIVGLNFSAADVMVQQFTSIGFSFCKVVQTQVLRFRQGISLVSRWFYVDEAAATITPGSGFVAGGIEPWFVNSIPDFTVFSRAVGITFRNVAMRLNLYGTSTVGGTAVTACGGGAVAATDGRGITIGTHNFQFAGRQPTRTSVAITESVVTVFAVELPGLAIGVTIGGLCAVFISTLTGTTTAASAVTIAGFGSTVFIDTATCTATGSAADIRTTGSGGTGGNVAYADLNLTNIWDDGGNRIFSASPALGFFASQALRCLNSTGVVGQPGQIVTGNGTSDQVKNATGNSATLADSSFLGVLVSHPATGLGRAFMVCSGYAFCLFDGAFVLGAIAYVSPTTPGRLTTTVPALALNNNKCRVGRVVATVAAGTSAIVALTPDALVTVADGLA